MNKELNKLIEKAVEAVDFIPNNVEDNYTEYREARREASAFIQDCVKEAYNLGRKDAFQQVFVEFDKYKKSRPMVYTVMDALWDIRRMIEKDLA